MNILVCIKHVPDTETRVKVTPDGMSLDLAGANYVVNPYDEFAVEAALQLKEAKGEGEVTLLTVGGDEAVKSLRQGLAMGADKAVLCKNDDFEKSDPRAVAEMLCAAIKKHDFGLVLFGKHGVGGDNQQVGSLVATLLDVPVITVVTKLEPQDGSVVCEREIEGGAEVVKAPLPAVITCQKGLNEPRYPSLKGIMAAKKKEITTFTPQDLGLDAGRLEQLDKTFELAGYDLPPKRPDGRILEGELDDQVKELVKVLHEEAKVI